MADYKLIGKDYQTPDLVAKVTGRAKYAEDFRAEGMAFGKLLLSPMPHCRVRRMEASAALATPGVLGLLTAEELPAPEGPQEAGLTNEPLYEGEPILMLAAETETIAADAIEQVRLDLEPLPFVLDPLDSLRPGGPNARLEGNTMSGTDPATIKWTAENFREVAQGRLPMDAEATETWHVGDVDAALAAADFVLDESIFFQTLSHQPLETRTTLALWQNGKCYVYPSVQSTARSHGPAARAIGISPSELVIVAEYCGGGFGSKISGYTSMKLPALLSKKIGRPVMLRVTRLDEHFIGRSRPGFQGRVKMGFRKDGRIVGMDLFLVQDGGPYGRSGDFLTAGDIASLNYQPVAMRFGGISIWTNTPPRSAQRGPGGTQIITMLEPLMDQAARRLGLDRVEIRKINAPAGQARYGRPRGDDGTQARISGSFAAEALDKAVEVFGWRERSQQSRERRGTRVAGYGIALSTFHGGSFGMDGLVVIKPDGRLYIHSGVGNLGTESFTDTARAAAEALNVPWEKVEVVWGDTSRHLPWSSSQGGSQTTHAHTRSNWAAGLDAKRKLQEIAARQYGGSPEHYEVANERVYRKGSSISSQGMSFATAARIAVELGGRFDGHEVPEDLNGMTKASAAALAGQGLMGVARDNFPNGGGPHPFVVGFAEVEVDVETGEIRIVDYAACAECGVVVHPRSLAAQLHGGGIQGFGIALGQKWVYDPKWGLAVAKRFYTNKPPSILDVPHEKEMPWTAVDTPDPFNPVGSKGIGEPPLGAGAAAVLCAIADAMGDAYFHRTPVTRDMILTKLESLPMGFEHLAAHV